MLAGILPGRLPPLGEKTLSSRECWWELSSCIHELVLSILSWAGSWGLCAFQWILQEMSIFLIFGFIRRLLCLVCSPFYSTLNKWRAFIFSCACNHTHWAKPRLLCPTHHLLQRPGLAWSVEIPLVHSSLGLLSSLRQPTVMSHCS